MATTLAEGVGILNQSLKNLGYDYQIDTTSTTTMTDGLEVIGAYPPEQLNAIMGQMNLILQARNFGVMFDAEKNPFRNFVVDMTEHGFGIEDIMHEIIEPTAALWDDKTNTDDVVRDLFSYDSNKIAKHFHTDSDSAEFKSTVDVRNYKKVFTAIALPRYIDTKLANMQWSAEIWLQNVGINLVKDMISKGDIVFSTGYNINNPDGVRNTVESIKATVGGFLTPNALYNKGVWDSDSNDYRPILQMSNSKNDIYIITTPENMERLKVQGYANAYNLSQFELDGRIMYVPAGTDLGEYAGEDVLFVVLDRRALLLGIKYWLGSSKFIENVHRVNHFLVVEILKGYNTFFNAVAFTGESVDDFFNSKGATLFLGETYNPSSFDSAIEWIEIDGVRYSSINDVDFVKTASNTPGASVQYVKQVRNYVKWRVKSSDMRTQNVVVNGLRVNDIYGSDVDYEVVITENIETIYLYATTA